MTTMISITALSFTTPAGYELSTLPRPEVTDPTDVVVRVHAASINPVDVKKANGVFQRVMSEQFPYKIGYDAAGIVIETGAAVTRLQVGDAVYVRLPEVGRGSWSEYAKCADRYVALKPPSLSFAEAAALPLAGVTALQALRQYPGSLEGKTVFVPAGLGGTGAYACQLAKNVLHAGKVITTVSTTKVPQVPLLLGQGVVDEIIDYTKQDPATAIPRGSVDFLFDTTGQAMAFLSLMTPGTSAIVSIATTPSATTMQASSAMQRPDHPRIPLIPRLLLNGMDAVRRLRAWRWGVVYQYRFLEPNAADLETLAGYVAAGQLVPVVGATVPLQDMERVRAACEQTYQGKGGVGKTVITVIE